MKFYYIYKKIILVLIIFSFISSINAQSCTNTKELLRKRHNIKGMTYGHPYTTFDRHNKNYKTLQNTIDNIRKNILKDKSISNVEELRGPVYRAYKAIYKNAKLDRPTDNGLISTNYGEVARSYLASWAKDNAFVFLIGLDSNGLKLDSLDTSGATRDSFRNRARNEAFDNLTGEIDHDNAGWGWVAAGGVYFSTNPITLAVALAAFNLYNEQKYLNKIQFCSRSLILWLQTYDLLKAAYEIRGELDTVALHRYPWKFGDADANTDGSCAPRRKLRKLTRDLYYYSSGLGGIVVHETGWKKNHGIAAASALLMSAQVLNDAGVETERIMGFISYVFTLGKEPWPYPRYSPVNWNELGQKGLEENLFVGSHWWPAHDVPVAPSKTWDSTYSPYSEGTQYTHYGLLDCGIPAMVAQKNITNSITNNT